MGEVVGKFLLEKILNVEVDEINDPELFELFDYKIKDLPIYIDFKNWHETTVFENSKMLDKIENKALKCQCKCAIICNIISERKWEVNSFMCSGVKILQIPSLLDESNPNCFREIAINETCK